VTNLRADPWERDQNEAMLYRKWWGEKLWPLMPAVSIVGQFLAMFTAYPLNQMSGSLSVEKALQLLEAGSRGGGK